MASTAVIAMLAISQKPERVSNILRSSTAVTRENGIRTGAFVAVRTAVRSIVVVLMLLLLLAGCRR